MINKSQDFNELIIQDLVFNHPETLPISDIDESYNPVIPVCKELNTAAGPLDMLLVTPNGDLVIVETKLWRNPEARRKVIAQILDYAKELANWSYEDLQREVNRNLKTKGNILYHLSTMAGDDLTLNESDFVDAVSRNLRLGKFMLLVVGDGIREGAKGIAEFLNRAGNLNFSLAMVEYSIYDTIDNNQLIIPRTIVKTVEVNKINIEVPQGFQIIQSQDINDNLPNSNSEISDELEERRQFHKAFWTELVNELEFDDPGQQLPVPSIGNNLYVYPANTKFCWISAYFAQSSNRVGVYFRFQRNNIGHAIKEHLEEFKNEIRDELDDKVLWQWEDNANEGFVVRLHLQEVYAHENRQAIKDFFKHWLNHFVNVLRPRLKDF